MVKINKKYKFQKYLYNSKFAKNTYITVNLKKTISLYINFLFFLTIFTVFIKKLCVLDCKKTFKKSKKFFLLFNKITKNYINILFF